MEELEKIRTELMHVMRGQTKILNELKNINPTAENQWWLKQFEEGLLNAQGIRFVWANIIFLAQYIKEKRDGKNAEELSASIKNSWNESESN